MSAVPGSAHETRHAAGAGPNAAKGPQGPLRCPGAEDTLPKPGRPPGPSAREGGPMSAVPGSAHETRHAAGAGPNAAKGPQGPLRCPGA